MAKRGKPMMTANLKLALKTQQRMELLGRLRMADWIEMPEEEFAREIQKIEKDPLFRKLFEGRGEAPGVISRQRWPRGRLSSSFYEVNEAVAAGGERVQVEAMLEDQVEVAGLIKKMGRAAFERYFVHGEQAPLDEIARRSGITPEEARKVNDFLLEVGARAEFQGPLRDPGLSKAYTCLARINTAPDGRADFEFFSPHWARGLYQVRYDLLDRWKSGEALAAEERRKLPHLLKRIETVNLRQNTLYRVLETLTSLQGGFFASHSGQDKRPISLRQLAHRLDLAPSTVSRALSGRSVRLPWGKEVPLIELVPGRRRVLRDIMSRWLEEGVSATDAALAERLKTEFSIRVSRRTVNAVRNELLKKPA